MSDPPVSDDEMTNRESVMVRPASRRWGFMDDGAFVPVPKGPLIQAGMGPPCVVTVRGGPRSIIEEPGE
jgi:hypothetical protein